MSTELVAIRTRLSGKSATIDILHNTKTAQWTENNSNTLLADLGQGAQGTPPLPLNKNVFIFMQCLKKVGQIVGCLVPLGIDAPLWEILDLQLPVRLTSKNLQFNCQQIYLLFLNFWWTCMISVVGPWYPFWTSDDLCPNEPLHGNPSWLPA